MLQRPLKKAVFPIAGLGTRFLPATKASPKEMLPIVDKPLIQYAVEEAYKAGIRQMIFITGRSKRAVEDHFDIAYELERELEISMKEHLLKVVRSVTPSDMQCVYIRQPKAYGLGHAVLCVREVVEHEPFALLLADDLMRSQTPVLKQLIQKFEEYQTSVIAVQEIPMVDTYRYGVIAGHSITEDLIDISRIVEKPAPEFAPSSIAVAGRYILTPSIFDSIEQKSVGVDNEIQLTDGISALLSKEKVLAYKFEGIRYDCGTKLGFLQATVDIAKSHSEVGLDFSTWLEKR